MDIDYFVGLVEKHFGFLLRDYGFSIVSTRGFESFGDCMVVLQSPLYKIAIVLDRSQVLLDIGSMDGSGKSASKPYCPFHVLSFLTQGPDQLNYAYSHDRLGDPKINVECQMIRLVGILGPFWGKVFNFFRRDGLIERQKALDKFLQERFELRYPNLAKSKVTIMKKEELTE